jgi:hypothetical protein
VHFQVCIFGGDTIFERRREYTVNVKGDEYVPGSWFLVPGSSENSSADVREDARRYPLITYSGVPISPPANLKERGSWMNRT